MANLACHHRQGSNEQLSCRRVHFRAVSRREFNQTYVNGSHSAIHFAFKETKQLAAWFVKSGCLVQMSHFAFGIWVAGAKVKTAILEGRVTEDWDPTPEE